MVGWFVAAAVAAAAVAAAAVAFAVGVAVAVGGWRVIKSDGWESGWGSDRHQGPKAVPPYDTSIFLRSYHIMFQLCVASSRRR